MSKPESIKVDPWTDFPRQSYSLFTDDFVHDKLLTWKVGSKGLNSTFNFKANVKADKAGYKVADELKFWFSLPEGRSLFAKTKSADYLKLQFDNGIITKWNKKWNLYATVNTNKALANPSLRLGVGHDSEHCHSNNRLRVDFNENDTNLTFYNRTLVRHNKCTFGNMIAYNITNKVLAKTNLLFGYKINNKVDTFVRVENANWRKYAFSLSEILQHLDLYRVDVVAQHDANIKYGVEVKILLFRPASDRRTSSLSMRLSWLSSTRISSRTDKLRLE